MKLKIYSIGAVLLLTGATLGYGLRGESGHRVPVHTATAGSAKSETRQVLYWYDPMYPATRFEQPGKSPFMDMDLVPRYAGEEEGVAVTIDPAQTQNLAVRTARAETGRLVFSRDIPAGIEFNDYQIAKVQPRAAGFVESVRPLAVGDRIDKGAAIAEITVPEWASDQSEYLLLKSQKASAHVVHGVRERMRLSGMPEELLTAVDRTGKVQTRLTVRAPLSGVVTEIAVYPGMNVEKSMTVAAIQGTDPVWVIAEIPERDVHLVRDGGRMRVSLGAWPDRVFYASDYTLLPKASAETRTVPLRLGIRNPEGLLRPGMTASIRLRSTGEESVLIPTQSLIDLGDEQRVIVRDANGAFIPRQVSVLRSSNAMTAVSDGLEAGEEVVVTGLFLIDSEANLRGALDRMRGNGVSPVVVAAGEARAGAETDHDHAPTGHAHTEAGS